MRTRVRLYGFVGFLCLVNFVAELIINCAPRNVPVFTSLSGGVLFEGMLRSRIEVPAVFNVRLVKCD